MIQRPHLLSCGCLGFFLLLGCSSTQTHRVAQYREAFYAYPADVQQAILSGQVETGYTPLQVYLALGPPNRSRIFEPPPVQAGDTWTYLGYRSGERFVNNNDPVILPSRGLEKLLITFGEDGVAKVEYLNPD